MYRVVIRCGKIYFDWLVNGIKTFFSRIKVTPFEDEMEIEIFMSKLEEEKLRLLDKVLNEYEKRFSKEVFLEVKDLSSGEPLFFEKEDFYKIGFIKIKYFSPSSIKFQNFDSNTIIIRTDYGFGNGQHPTTHICIEMILNLLKDHKLNSALDFGCGTGILGIVTSKIFNVKTVGVDIDPLCVKIAKKNATLNRVEDKVRFIHGSWERIEGGYDLIMANITPSLILESYKKIYYFLNKGGYSIVSGFLNSQFNDIKEAFKSLNFNIVETAARFNWIGMLLKK